MDMRGLANFIQDIRKATSNRDEEQRRIDVELSKIRSKFRETGKLTAYDRKKYVCKLMFIAMLGYTVDFGHMEGVQLLSGDSTSEKLIGYLSLSVFLNENHELLTLTTHTVHLDLLSGKEFNTCLALTAIGNAGGKDFAEAMSHGVEKLILAKVSPNVKKKAFLAMLRLYRKYKAVVDLSKIVPVAVDLITDSNMGVANCAVTFIQGILESSEEVAGPLSRVPANCIAVLERIIMHKSTEVDYIYYSVPAPWLQTKLIRLLQYFPRPEAHLLDRAVRILEKIQSATDRVLADAQTHQRQRGTQNRCNAMNAVLAEVVSLVIQWDCRSLLDPCQKTLKAFVKDRKEANLRYMGLALTARLSFCNNIEARYTQHIEDLQQEIFLALEDPDVSIRKKALELLYTTCTRQTAREIIDRFTEYIPHTEATFRADLVLVIAALAEKYCTDNAWYCEALLHLLQAAGDSVPRDVWHRLVHVVVDTPSIQKRLTEAAFAALLVPASPEVILTVASFLLGEFGYTIAVNAGSEPIAQINALYARLSTASADAKCVVLSALCKLYNLYAVPSARDRIVRIFEQFTSNVHPEIQQRAVEYLTLVTTLSDETLQRVLEPLPPFGRGWGVGLLARLRGGDAAHRGTDRDLWAEKAQERDERQVAAAAAQRHATAGPAPVFVAEANETPSASAAATAGSLATQPTLSKKDLEAAFDRIAPTADPDSNRAAKAAGEAARAFFAVLAEGAAKGPLFASDAVRIGVTQEYRGADGRLTLTIENCLPVPIEGFSVSIVATPANLVLQSKPVPAEIPPSSSISVLFACRCLGGYSDYPTVSVQWKGGPATHLRLPIGVQKFMSPYPLEGKAQFEALWGGTSPGISALATVPQPIAFGGSRQNVTALLTRIGFWTGADADGSSIFAAASFAAMPSGTVFQPVLVHIAVEGEDKGALLVTSPTMEAQLAVKSLLSSA